MLIIFHVYENVFYVTIIDDSLTHSEKKIMLNLVFSKLGFASSVAFF